MSRRKYTTIDLFSGAGGLSVGFHKTKRYKSIFAVEFEHSAAGTYARNFKHKIVIPDKGSERMDISRTGIVFNGDIRTIGNINFKADIIIGGPPCQGFSPLGKMSPRDEHLKMNQLWQEYMRIVSQVKPLAFVIENVPELLTSKEALAIKVIGNRLGYSVTSGELRAVDFGVPQRRIRAFIVGIMGNSTPTLPLPNYKFTSVRDAIQDLPLYPDTTELEELPEDTSGVVQKLHIGRNPTEVSLRRYRLIPPGGNRFDLMRKAPEITPRCWLEKPTGSTDVFGRLEWDAPAYTIRTEFFKPEKGCYLHPEAHRPITHREAARLQTFPDEFVFTGSKIQIAKQIGNAVPPKLAQEVAKSVASQLDLLPVDQLRASRVPLSCEEFQSLLVEVTNELYGPTRSSINVNEEDPIMMQEALPF